MPRSEFTPGDVHKVLRAHVGRRRAIKGGDVAQVLGFRGRYADRGVRTCVRALRRMGILVLSVTENNADGPPGYFLAADAHEWRRFGQPLRNRATDLLKTVSRMDQAASAEFGVPPELRPAVQLALGLTQPQEAP